MPEKYWRNINRADEGKELEKERVRIMINEVMDFRRISEEERIKFREL